MNGYGVDPGHGRCARPRPAAAVRLAGLPRADSAGAFGPRPLAAAYAAAGDSTVPPAPPEAAAWRRRPEPAAWPPTAARRRAVPRAPFRRRTRDLGRTTVGIDSGLYQEGDPCCSGPVSFLALALFLAARRTQASGHPRRVRRDAPIRASRYAHCGEPMPPAAAQHASSRERTRPRRSHRHREDREGVRESRGWRREAERPADRRRPPGRARGPQQGGADRSWSWS